MALSDNDQGISALPLRGTDAAGRLKLLRQAGLVKGDVESGLRLICDSTLLAAAGLMDPPVENVIGAIPYQLGLAAHFRINGRDALVPMAVREPTIIAGVSNAAKLARPEGFAVDVGESNIMTAEIVFGGYKSHESAHRACRRINGALEQAAWQAQDTPSTRGRVVHRSVRCVRPKCASDSSLVVVKITVDAGDYMGARMAIGLAERLASHLTEPAGRKAETVICSNHGAGRIVIAKAWWSATDIGPKYVKAILDLQTLAAADRDRAVTHNKGVLNGVMGVCRATGQDEEAINAAVYSLPASALGRIVPLTTYALGLDGRLEGRLEMRIPVATLGGATQDPFAKMCRALMDVDDGRGLAQVIGAVGLAANLAALLCLVKEGILAAFKKVRQQ